MPSWKKTSHSTGKRKKKGLLLKNKMKFQIEQDDRLGTLQKKDATLQDSIHDMNINILKREQLSTSLRRKIAVRRRRLVCRSSVSRKVFKGINASKEQRRMVEKLNSMLEFRLNKTRTKSSTNSMLNEALRNTINLKRIDQTRKKKDCKKMDQEFRELQAKLAGLLSDATSAAEEGDMLRERIEDIARKNDNEIRRFHQRMQQFKEYILKSKEAVAMIESLHNHPHQNEKDDDNVTRERKEYERMLRGRNSNTQSSALTSSSTQIYKKINAEKAFRIMQKKTGLAHISEVVSRFVELELDNFRIYKEIMSVKVENQRVEKHLRDLQKEMDKYKEQEAADNASRIDTVNEIKNRKKKILHSVEMRCSSIKSQNELISKMCDTIQHILCKFIDSPLRFQSSTILAPIATFRKQQTTSRRKSVLGTGNAATVALKVLKCVLDPHKHHSFGEEELKEDDDVVLADENESKKQDVAEEEKKNEVLNSKNITKAIVLVQESVEELLTTIVKTCRTMGVKVRKDAARVPPPNSRRRAPLRAKDYSVIAPTLELDDEDKKKHVESKSKSKVRVPSFFYSKAKVQMYGNTKKQDEDDLPTRPLTAKELMDEIRVNAESKRKKDEASKKQKQQEESSFSTTMFESTNSNNSPSSTSSSSKKVPPIGPKLNQYSTMVMRSSAGRSRGRNINSNVSGGTRRETVHHTRRATTAMSRSPSTRTKFNTAPNSKLRKFKLPVERSF